MSDQTSQQSDSALLKAWVAHRDRDAIGQLISQHINFVHAVAYRQVRGDAHLAEDVTQAVFILLLQKAHRIQSEAAMASWLFTTTRYAAANAMKMVRRRKYYEHQAALNAQTETTSDAMKIEDENLEPLLNDAINSLPKSDRTCVIMSYLQQKTHRQVAAVMGLSEEAARKRVSRAIERMREFLVSRGAAAPVAVIGSSLAKQTMVSAQFMESTLNVAMLSQSTVQSGSAITIAKGVSKMFFAMKMKVAAAGAVLLFGGLVTAQVVQRALSREAGVVMTAQGQDAPKHDAANTDSSTVSLGDGVVVNFVGVAKWGTDDWYSIDGKPIAKPASLRLLTGNPPPTYQALIRVTSPADAIADVHIPQAGSWGSKISGANNITVADKGTRDFMCTFSLRPGEQSADLIVDIADGPWKTALTTTPGSHVSAMDGDGIDATFTPLIERDGNAVVYVSASHVTGPWRLIGKDINGLTSIADEGGGAGNDGVMTCEFRFGLPAVFIKSLEIQVRPYRKHVTARNITLDPTKPTTPQIVVQNTK
jgi:RNA polymerase sigma factor (sigma-70 family)